jgi:hypothetical protein
MFSVFLLPFRVQNVLLIKKKKISQKFDSGYIKNADLESVEKFQRKKWTNFAAFHLLVGQSFRPSNFFQ